MNADVRYCAGGVWLRDGGRAVAIDAPAGFAAAIGPHLATLEAVVLTSGRARSVAGLVDLLEAAAAARDPERPLTLHVPLGDERGAALADLWVQHWPDRYPLTIDAQRPGAAFDVGPITVTTLPIRIGEPRWRTGAITPLVGMAVAVQASRERVAVVLGAAPSSALARWCEGADLAVVEVGVAPWPRTDAPWRLRPDEAVAVGRGARALWLVGDDGERLRAAD